MKKAIVVHTNPSKLAAKLVRTETLFKQQCSEFGIEVHPGMKTAYESGFGAALLTLGIPGESLVRMSQMADKLRENPEEICDCPNCK